MFMTIGDSNCFELKASETTADHWREIFWRKIFEDVDIKAIWVEEAKKDKDQATQAAICYDVLL